MALSPLDQIVPLLTEQFDMLIDKAHGTFNITIKNQKVIDICLDNLSAVPAGKHKLDVDLQPASLCFPEGTADKLSIRILVIMKRKILNMPGRDGLAKNKISRDKATVFIFPPNQRVKGKVLEYFRSEISAPLFIRRSSSYFDEIVINGHFILCKKHPLFVGKQLSECDCRVMSKK